METSYIKNMTADLISRFSLEVYSEPGDAAFKTLRIRWVGDAGKSLPQTEVLA